jgi:hypothetical protein
MIQRTALFPTSVLFDTDGFAWRPAFGTERSPTTRRTSSSITPIISAKPASHQMANSFLEHAHYACDLPPFSAH